MLLGSSREGFTKILPAQVFIVLTTCAWGSISCSFSPRLEPGYRWLNPEVAALATSMSSFPLKAAESS